MLHWWFTAFCCSESTTDPISGEYGSAGGNTNLIYGVFSTPYDTVKMSAICAFSMFEIQKIFSNSGFKPSSGSYCTPTIKTDEPRSRPGDVSHCMINWDLWISNHITSDSLLVWSNFSWAVPGSFKFYGSCLILHWLNFVLQFEVIYSEKKFVDGANCTQFLQWTPIASSRETVITYSTVKSYHNDYIALHDLQKPIHPDCRRTSAPFSRWESEIWHRLHWHR